jgi:PAS domain S-box-containing protein
MVQSDHVDEDRSIMGGVIKSGEPLLIPAIDPEQIKAITLPALKEYIDQVGIQSILIVPVIGRSGVLGAMSLSRHRSSNPFKMDDQSFLMDIAYRTALAIENCRLFESLRLEIAERLSTKQRLESSEERFRAIFESTTLGIKVLDLDGNILQTNPAFQRMLGYSNAEFFGRHYTDFLFPADIPQALKLLKDLKISGATQYLFEHRAVTKDNSIVWVKTTFSPVYTSNGNRKMAYIVGILENVSERKRIELQMKELRDRLQSNIELERLRMAQELHDNPMQSLYSVIYRVEELRSSANPDQDKALKKITSEVQMVIDSLRATAQELRPPTIFDFGLENAIRSYVDDFSEKHPNLKISLSLAQDRQLLPENIRLALFRIFQQSLMNVVRHADATKVKVRFAFDPEEVRLEISDNGQGFEVPTNWMEFVRSGHYGLAGASERVDSLGGTFMVESNPGNTTTVTVAIPWKELQ